MTQLTQVANPQHEHAHAVWVLPDSPLGRWSASLAAGGALLVVACGVVAAFAVDGPWMFLLLGLTLWAVVVAAAAGVMAALALVRDHAVTLALVAVLGVAALVAVALQLAV